MPSLKFVICLLIILSVAGCLSTKNDESDRDMVETEKGRYLVLIMGCNDCHTTSPPGSDSYGPEENWLTGSTQGFTGSYGTVYPTNLRLLINEIEENEWLSLAQQMRSNSPMAWTKLPSLTYQDLKSIYRFVRQLGPKGVPAPENLPPGVMPTTDFIPFPLPH